MKTYRVIVTVKLFVGSGRAPTESEKVTIRNSIAERIQGTVESLVVRKEGSFWVWIATVKTNADANTTKEAVRSIIDAAQGPVGGFLSDVTATIEEIPGGFLEDIARNELTIYTITGLSSGIVLGLLVFGLFRILKR